VAIFPIYRRTVLHLVRAIALLFSIICAIIFVLNMLDITFSFHWGYDRYSLIFAGFAICIGLTISRIAATLLKRES